MTARRTRPLRPSPRRDWRALTGERPQRGLPSAAPEPAAAPDAPVGAPEPDRRRRRDRAARPRTDTRFRPGNRAWAARRSPGRRRRFADADALEAACCAYFAWSDAHPLIHREPVVWRGKLTMLLEVPRLRPYSIAGMCTHLRIGVQTWRDYRRRAAFSWVCERVESVIWVEQFEAAAAGLLDPRIIWASLARERRAERARRAGAGA